MKVLHLGKFYPPRWGGMETALKDLCEVTAARGFDVEALVADEKWRGTRSVVNGVCIRRVGAPVTLLSQPIAPGVLFESRRADAGIVHLHEPNPLATIAWLTVGAPVARTPVVVHYHSDIVKQRWCARMYRPLQTRLFDKASSIIVGSRELLDSSPVLAPWRTKCAVIPFGIDLTPFLRIRRQDRSAGRGRILAVGRLSYYKGFQYLIEAQAGLDAELCIVGEGEMRPQLERQIEGLGLKSRVVLAGRVTTSELVEHYRWADVFCLPSCERSEAFGLVQVEAMAAGLPVIATDIPTGARSISVPGQTGLRVPPRDVPALAAALRRLLENHDQAIAMGAAGRERAVAEYSREVMGERVCRLYARVLEAHGASIPQSLESMQEEAA